MAAWKNWKASAPPIGRWLACTHAALPTVVFPLDPAAVTADDDMSNIYWLDLTAAEAAPLPPPQPIATKPPI